MSGIILLPKPGGAGGAAAWGAISGTLTDQADLVGVLGAKAPVASPTFTGTPVIPDGTLVIADTNGLQAALDAKATPADIAAKHLDPNALDHGCKAWTYDPAAGANTNTPVPTGGLLHLQKLWTRSAQTISGITVIVAAAGSGLTQVGFGLWSAAGVLLASSVDTNGATAAAFNTLGTKPVIFSSPPSINGGFYWGMWFVGTTGPGIIRSSNLTALGNINLSAPNLRFCTANTGLTGTAPATLGAETALTTCYFAVAV